MCLLLRASPMVFYLIPAALVFSIALQAFLEDASTPKNHFDSWVLLVLAALLWPITFPAIVKHRISEASHASSTNDKSVYPTAPGSSLRRSSSMLSIVGSAKIRP
jgi:hypothetical protein